MSLYDPMDTDHRQTLLGLNQDKELERLISDVMNHKVSPNALAESRELVQLGYALECLKDTLGRLRERKALAAVHGLH